MHFDPETGEFLGPYLFFAVGGGVWAGLHGGRRPCVLSEVPAAWMWRALRDGRPAFLDYEIVFLCVG